MLPPAGMTDGTPSTATAAAAAPQTPQQEPAAQHGATAIQSDPPPAPASSAAAAPDAAAPQSGLQSGSNGTASPVSGGLQTAAVAVAVSTLSAVTAFASAAALYALREDVIL
jgi:hypothetical protein